MLEVGVAVVRESSVSVGLIDKVPPPPPLSVVVGLIVGGAVAVGADRALGSLLLACVGNEVGAGVVAVVVDGVDECVAGVIGAVVGVIGACVGVAEPPNAVEDERWGDGAVEGIMEKNEVAVATAGAAVAICAVGVGISGHAVVGGRLA